MWTSAVTRGVAAMVVGVALVPVASATAQTGGGPAADRANSAPLGEHHDQLVLRRDPEQAVPFDPAAGTDDVPVLHRDGSQAVPFVAEVGPSANSPDEAGFNWGDALIG